MSQETKTRIIGYWLNQDSPIPKPYMNCLSRAELARSEAQNDKRRHEYLLGRILIRSVLSECFPEIKPEEWTLPAEGSLQLDAHFKFKISLSHSGRYLCCVLAKDVDYLGVDFEQVKSTRNILGVAKHWFSAKEYLYLSGLNAQQQNNHFYLLWTAKEAYLKALGVGISGGLARLQAVYDGHSTSFTFACDAEYQQRWKIFCYQQEDSFLSVALAMDESVDVCMDMGRRSDRESQVSIEWFSAATLLTRNEWAAALPLPTDTATAKIFDVGDLAASDYLK